MDNVRRCGGLAESPPACSLEGALDDVVRNGPSGLSWDALSAVATLVVTPNGGAIRTIITGRRHITTGVYASRKAGRGQPYESMNERAFFMHCEVDTEVVDYRAQMFRLEFVLDGRKRTYIVDCVRLLASGVIELVEIKNDRRALKDPDYALKLDAVRTVCDRIGWRLRVIFKSTLFGPPHIYRNISDVQSWRLTEYGKADVFEVARRLQGGVSLTLAELADHLGGRVVGAAKLKAMMVERIVRLDLSQPLSPTTAVTLLSDQMEGA